MFKSTISLCSTLLIFSGIGFSETIKNIDYAGTGKVEHTLNLYVPSGSGPFPVVIHYTGLAFSWSDAKSDGGLANSYNAAGFAVVGANLSGGGSGTSKAHYPAQIQELKATVRFLRANADKYNLDPKFIGVIGFSSGAWNAAILATTGDVDEYKVGSTTMKLEGEFGGNLEFSSRVQAAWASAPPTDFLAMDGCGSMINHGAANSPEGGLIGGALAQNKEKCALANPITYISKDDPPIRLVHGSSDNIVPTCQSELMWAALQKNGNKKDQSYTPVSGGHAANFNGSLDFFKKALTANKEGCLDTSSASFDPLATYCSTGNCCTAVRTQPLVTVKVQQAANVHGFDLVNTSASTVTYKIFDAAGHVLATGQIASKGSFNLKETGSGLRLYELRGNGVLFHGKVICTYY